jgi:hypothetical protein
MWKISHTLTSEIRPMFLVDFMSNPAVRFEPSDGRFGIVDRAPAPVRSTSSSSLHPGMPGFFFARQVGTMVP